MTGPRRTVTAAGGARASEGVRTGWGVPTERLDDLVDHDGFTAAPADSVMVKGPDGIARPRAHAPMRGAAIRMTDTAPVAATSDQRGDLHLTHRPDGGIDVYQYDEET